MDIGEEAVNNQLEQAAAAASGDGPNPIRGRLVMKHACEEMTEDLGYELSGYVFKAAKDNVDQKLAAAAFCGADHAQICARKKKPKKKKAPAPAAAGGAGAPTAAEKNVKKARKQNAKAAEAVAAMEDDPMNPMKLEKTLGKDKMRALQEMMQQAKDNPALWLAGDDADRLAKAQADSRFQCEVCGAVIRAVVEEVRAGMDSDEAAYGDALERACKGDPDLSANMLGVEPPNIPASWTDRVKPVEEKGRFKLTTRKAKDRKARDKARREGDGKHFNGLEDMMLTLTCPKVIDVAPLAEALYKRRSETFEPASLCVDTRRRPCESIATPEL